MSTESFQPIETTISLEQPVTIYTAKELAVMPLSVMNAAIEAQEKFAVLEHTTKMGGGSHINTAPQGGWIQAESGQGNITHPLQDQQRVYPTKDYSSVREARISKVGGVNV